MVDPKVMCRKHLLGEHVECHMLLGSLKKGTSIDGFLKKELVDPSRLDERHSELAEEMERRGFNHKSPLDSSGLKKVSCNIDKDKSFGDLMERCEECRRRR